MIQHVRTARAKSSLILAVFVALGFGPPHLISASQSHSVLDSSQRPTQSALQPDKATESAQELHGDMLMAEKKYQAAIKEYEQAPQGSAIVANKMGMAYHYMLNATAAKACYERALKLNPKYPQAMNNLGTIYYSEKKYPPGREDVQESHQAISSRCFHVQQPGHAVLRSRRDDEGGRGLPQSIFARSQGV